MRRGKGCFDPCSTVYVEGRFAKVKFDYHKGETMKPLLTKREQEIIELIAKGRTDKEAGLLLSISTATVSTHLKNSYRKLNATNRVEALYKLRLQCNPALA